jgi:hypothetical protein
MSAKKMIRSLVPDRRNADRIGVGGIWLAGATFNALVTLRMERPFEWLEESIVPVYSWFFRDVAGANPQAWTLALIACEVALGVLTLARGGWARLGLAGGALFSLFLFSLGTVYTLVMGPYAALLGWMFWRDTRRGEHRHRLGEPELHATAG